MKKRIKYIGFFDAPIWSGKRKAVLSANNKMTYLIEKINSLGQNVDIYSTSWITQSNGHKQERKITNFLGDNTVRFTPSSIFFSKGSSLINSIMTILWLSKSLIKGVKKEEEIIVYHSLFLFIPIYLVKKIKKCKIILQVEEKYTSVWSGSKIDTIIEQKMFQLADKLILASSGLIHEIAYEKKFILFHGVYRSKYESVKSTISSNEINLLYSGEIETLRNGSFNSLKIMKYLPNNYSLSILGNGNEKDLKTIKLEIEAVNKSLNRNACKYYGVLTGAEYDRFLFRCDIGLNPQEIGDYMDTAFPSKILDYMTHGLTVVSSEIESIKNSEVGELISLVRTTKPESFSDVITKLCLKKTAGKTSELELLDRNFQHNLRGFLQL